VPRNGRDQHGVGFAETYGIAKADSTLSVEARIIETVSTEAMISDKAAFSIGTPGASSSSEGH
jgi:hypothetical protein